MKVTIYENIEQRSIEWNQLRMGKVGGSQLATIIDQKTGILKKETKSTTPIITAISKLIAEIKTDFSNDSDFQSDSMLWGVEEEADAIKEIATEDSFQCGYVTNSDYKYFGISPDLLSAKTGWEIKCPNSSTFADWVIKGGLPIKHKVQVMDYFVMMPELDTMVFVIYDSRYPENNLRKIKIKRADNLEFIANMSNAMKEFDKLVDKYLKLF